jgi:hypothetical protein
MWVKSDGRCVGFNGLCSLDHLLHYSLMAEM